MELLLGITICFQLGALTAGFHTHWGYAEDNERDHLGGPSTWQTSFATCGGKRQSPINIETSSVEVKYWQPFTFKNYEVPAAMTAANFGHIARVELDSRVTPIISQGGLKGDYVFAFMKFHWGSDSAQGSEHTIDNVRYPLEMSIVNYKKSYGDLGQSISKSDGLAILSVLFEVAEADNAAFTPLVNAFATITNAGTVVELSNPYPLRAFLPDDTEKFYRYEGSITTPTCNEAVIWTVFDTTVKISENQLDVLRMLNDEFGDKLFNNYRPTQPLNGRKVLMRGGEIPPSSDSLKMMILAMFFLSTVAIIMMSL